MDGAEVLVNSGWDIVGKMAAETHHHSSTRDLFRESEKAEKHTQRKKQNREMQKVGWVIDPRKSRILPKWDLLMDPRWTAIFWKKARVSKRQR